MKVPFLIITVFCLTGVHGQAVISKKTSAASSKTILDFGAVPNDGKDDTWAFIKAGKYFSNLWDINGVPLRNKRNFSYQQFAAELIIPAGTYDVGKQITIPPGGLKTTYGDIFGYPAAFAPIERPQKNSFKFGLELIVLENPENNINGFTIKGMGKTKPVINYNKGLQIGYFDENGQPLFMTDADYNGYSFTGIGDLIKTKNCKNIRVQNIEINGRNEPSSTNYGGAYGSNMIQAGATGINLINTKNVLVENVDVHHMTMDGIQVHDFYKDTIAFPKQTLSNVLIQNSTFDLNRRQGMSWVGGRKLLVKNCKFNNTGRTVDGVAVGTPAAGVDIEPESDDLNVPLFCIDGTFNDCEFINNKGCATLCDEAAARAKNVTFNRSKMHSVDNYSAWTKGSNFVYNDCKIWGGFVYGYVGISRGEETVFNRCDFADEEISSRPGVYRKGKFLLESNISTRTKFNNCTFRTLHKEQSIAFLYLPSSDESDFFTFTNCSFIVGENAKGSNTMFGCAFNGATNFTSLNQNENESFNLNGVVFLGNTDPKKKSVVKLRGRVILFPALTNGRGMPQFVIGRNGPGTNKMNGFADFIIGKNSCLYTYWNQTIDIGSNARLINTSGGQLGTLSATINNAGKLILEDGSYTAFAYPIKINTSTSGAPDFYVHKNALFRANIIWGQQIGWAATVIKDLLLSDNTKISGENESVPLKLRVKR